MSVCVVEVTAEGLKVKLDPTLTEQQLEDLGGAVLKAVQQRGGSIFAALQSVDEMQVVDCG